MIEIDKRKCSLCIAMGLKSSRPEIVPVHRG